MQKEGSFKGSTNMTEMKIETCVCLLAFLGATCLGHPLLKGKIYKAKFLIYVFSKFAISNISSSNCNPICSLCISFHGIF